MPSGRRGALLHRIRPGLDRNPHAAYSGLGVAGIGRSRLRPACAFLFAAALFLGNSNSRAEENATPPGSTARIPSALQRFRQLHDASRIGTARIEWSKMLSRDTPEKKMYFTWRCAGDDIISVARGDQDGVLFRTEDGAPAPEIGYRQVSTLVKDGRSWTYQDSALEAKSAPGNDQSRAMTLDFRCLGLNPIYPFMDWDAYFSKYPDVTHTYSSEQDGPLEKVTAWQQQRGEDLGRCVWWIDPARDFAVVRAQVYVKDQLSVEFQFDLKQIDGVWFPRRVRQRLARSGELIEEIEVISAQFNRPDHPVEFTPADIGIEPGTLIVSHDEDAAHRFWMWDGHDLAVLRDWAERVAKGEAAYGPNLMREHRRRQARLEAESLDAEGDAPAASRPSFDGGGRQRLSKWEEYTCQFVQRYQLNADQSHRAWAILRDCQEQAHRYLDTRRAEIERLERAFDSRSTTSPATGGNVRVDVRDKLEALLAPVDEIFSARLVPRLESLPTRTQRASASTAAPPPCTQQASP